MLKLKFLSCFCKEYTKCNNFNIGVMMYSFKKLRLHVEDVYGPDSKSNVMEENSTHSEQIITPTRDRPQTECEHQPSTLKKTLKKGDFILVKLPSRKTEYRYVAMCTGLEKDDEGTKLENYLKLMKRIFHLSHMTRLSRHSRHQILF